MSHAIVTVLGAGIIERVGGYVGFFALIGLAILSLLYFSQARDVRRLREWAGRAPERAAEAEQRGGYASPQQPTVVRRAATPAAAPATPAAGGPATTPATPAAKASAPPVAPGPGTPAGVQAAAGAAPGTEQLPAVGSDNGDEPHDASQDTGEHDDVPGTLPAPAPTEAFSPVDQPTVAHTPLDEDDLDDFDPERDLLPYDEDAEDEPHYLPGTSFREADERRRKPVHQRARNVHIPGGGATIAVLAGAILVAVLLVVTGVFGGGSDSGNKQTAKQSQKAPSAAAGGGTSANVDPSQVTVAVLNGTTTTGLAYRVSQEAKTGGFQLGTVTNAATTDQTKSEVLYAPGQKNGARAVADRLGITTIAPIDSVNAEIAGSADAIVLVGADRS